MRIGLAGAGRIGAFHAATLASLDGIDEVVVGDSRPAVADAVAASLPTARAVSVDDLVDSGIDALVIATSTPGHAPLLRAAVAARLPTFCEKPVAATLDETIEVVPSRRGMRRRRCTSGSSVASTRATSRARDAVASGELGFVHTRARQHQRPPPPRPGYVPTSGGIFRDCCVHDCDVVRFVTGREVLRVCAAGGDQGRGVLPRGRRRRLRSGAAHARRRHHRACCRPRATTAQGHDVRLEVLGSQGSVAVGLRPLAGAAVGRGRRRLPPGAACTTRSWTASHRPTGPSSPTSSTVARGEAPSPCTVRDALEAFRVAEACTLSLQQARPVDLAEIPTAAALTTPIEPTT